MHTKLFLVIAAVVVAGVAGLAFFTIPRVANLEGFTALAENDPLFYSPFFDEASFAASVAALARAEDELKAAALANIKAADADFTETFTALITQYDLFPKDFLAALAEVPPATDAFLAEPTPAGARALVRHYEAAAAAYAAAAAETLAAFDRIAAYLPKNRPAIYFFTDGATTVDLVRSDFRLIADNARALAAEVERRKQCLYGEAACETPQAPALDDTFLAALETGPMPENGTTAFVRAHLPFENDSTEVRGPYRVPSACWPSDGGAPHWLYLISAELDGVPRVLPKLATEQYYLLVPEGATDSLHRALAEAGLSFYAQPETTTYECTDLTFYPRILALDFVARALASGAVTREALADDPRYALLAANPFSLLAPVFNAHAGFTNLLRDSQRGSGDFILSPQFLFTMRSAYSLTYMPSSASVWRIGAAPKYLLSPAERARVTAPAQHVTYSELKARGLSDDEISKAHINQRDFIDSLSGDAP